MLRVNEPALNKLVRLDEFCAKVVACAVKEQQWQYTSTN